MTTFTFMVEMVARKKELTSKKAVAEHLGCNPSTLSSALKSDSKETPYMGALLEPVKEAYDAARSSDGSTTRATPAGRLGSLRKLGDNHWTAVLDSDTVDIKQIEPKKWQATVKKDVVAGNTTFKGIIGDLREMATANK